MHSFCGTIYIVFSPILQSALNIKLLIRIFEYMSNDGDDTKSTHRYKKVSSHACFYFGKDKKPLRKYVCYMNPKCGSNSCPLDSASRA